MAHTAGKHLISTKTVVKKAASWTHAVKWLAILFAVLWTGSLHALTYGEWTTSAADAKRLAQSTNRPLLAVFYAGTNCSKCETLEDVAWETVAFKKFARDNKIVLYRNKVSSNNLRINSYYKSKIVETSGAPTFFIFKVNNNATFDDESYKAFTEDQVTLPQATSTSDSIKYTGRSFAFNTSIFGVKVGSNAGTWNETMAETIIRNCFPNNVWSSLTSTIQPDDPDDPVNPDDPDDPVNPDDPDDPSTPTELTNTDKWLGKWLTSAVEAKKYARENNRPLLAVFYAGTNCSKCETLEDVAWETAAFKQYAINNKLVLYRNKVSSNNLRINTLYKSQLGDTTGAPTFFIFKVNSNASSTSETYTAFLEDEVSIPQVTWNTFDSNRYTGRTFVFGSSILDVRTGSNAGAWNETMVENIINNCFPNNYWKSMEVTSGGGTNPVDPDDPDDPVDPDDPDDPVDPSELIDSDKWLGKWLTNAGDAKRYALENNRPLLAVFYAGTNCSKCETLEDVAWETAAFKRYATERQL
ncbi:MAG: thioredoxin family protein, partial [Victivallales bacterium]|nr:thioredoxin family protein [Victivallales bacterium]